MNCKFTSSGACRSRRGSALLIVLGFLSFMVVSAVAFSFWMRSERAPSSAYRRTVAARHLVKAGLNRAIAELDYAIKDNPFPGVINTAHPSPTFSRDDGNGYFDQWYGRVFMPPNPALVSGNSAGGTRRFATRSDTVSVLTLEGLGYIPAPLVNDVRFNSRASWAASWKDLDYDAGRYAYCAVNVSDFFDINRVGADARSASKDGRISMAYLFNDNPSSYGNVNASAAESFNQFLDNRGGDSSLPFVSLLDFNLANSGEAAGVSNPFYELASGNASDSFAFYDTDTNQYFRQVFTTDSWFPSTNSTAAASDDTATKANLSNIEHQPFEAFNARGFNDLYNIFADYSKIVGNKYFDCLLHDVGIIGLYDYLDEDNVPSALAMPSIERIPMITSLEYEPLGGCSLSLTMEDDTKVSDLPKPDPKTGVPSETEVTITTTVSATLALRTSLGIGTCYPFRPQGDDDVFKVQGMARFFLAPENLNTRLANRGKQYAAPDSSCWNSNITNPKNGVLTVRNNNAPNVKISSSAGVKPAMSRSDVELNFNATSFEVARFTRKLKWDTKDAEWKEQYDTVALVPGSLNWAPLGTDGNPRSESDIANDNYTYHPHVVVSARIRNGDDYTVDLVPAGQNDDDLNSGKMSLLEGMRDEKNSICGRNNPVFDFRFDNAEISIGLTQDRINALHNSQKISGGGDNQLGLSVELVKPEEGFSISCVDPRFNYAPEDWYVTANAINSWYDNNNPEGMNGLNRDRDMYLSTNDSEWMYSIGELLFLPRFGTPTDTSVDNGGFHNAGKYGGTWFRSRKSPAETANYAYCWTSYSLDDIYGIDGNTRALSQYFIDDDGSGPRANPYTDNAGLFAAAIANTPVSYWAASTNRNWSSISEALKYTLSEAATEPDSVKVTRSEIDEFAEKFQKAIRNNDYGKRGDWQRAYDEIWADYFDDAGELAGTFLDNTKLHDADRKFLFSFWRNCFSNRQQLFLIFVRAESSVLGGAGENMTPSQLGARAVALVWRDPAAPNVATDGDSGDGENRYPHRTRILFYHQFD